MHAKHRMANAFPEELKNVSLAGEPMDFLLKMSVPVFWPAIANLNILKIAKA